MNINDFKRKIQEKQAEITKAIHRTLPIKIGRKAADHFQDNFRKGGFAVGHPPIPVSLATPPRPMPSSPKTTPISQKTATTAPSTNICTQFAKMGHEVKMTPRVHRKSDDYQRIYGSLIGTKYENKCPDFSINGVFYEYESYEKPWNKNKVGNMLSHGLKQASHLVINNNKGCSFRFIRKAIIARLKIPNQSIDEVWIYQKGECILFYKNGTFMNN